LSKLELQSERVVYFVVTRLDLTRFFENLFESIIRHVTVQTVLDINAKGDEEQKNVSCDITLGMQDDQFTFNKVGILCLFMVKKR
jgi:hypothetical protein